MPLTIRPGHGDLELEIHALVERAESEAERAFVPSLLPACRTAADLTGEPVVVFAQPTLAWIPCRPDWMIGVQDRVYVIEVDGYRWHSSKSRFASDRERDRKLASSGMKVLRFTAKEALSNNWGPPADEIARLVVCGK